MIICTITGIKHRTRGINHRTRGINQTGIALTRFKDYKEALSFLLTEFESFKILPIHSTGSEVYIIRNLGITFVVISAEIRFCQ
jgi:hypothetical protein